MPRSSRSRSGSAGKRRPRDVVNEPTAAVLEAAATPIVRWRDVARTLEAVGNAIEPTAALAPVTELAEQLVAPLLLLSDLQQLTGQSRAGNRAAAAELLRRIDEIARALPETTRAGAAARDAISEHESQSARVAPPPRRRETSRSSDAEPGESAAPGVVREQGFAELMAAVVSAYSQRPAAERERVRAIDTLLGLVVYTEPLSRLLTALEREGQDAVGGTLQWLGALSQPDCCDPPTADSTATGEEWRVFEPGHARTDASHGGTPMSVLSGGLPVPIPGLPGGPKPGLPGGPRGPVDFGDYLGEWLKQKTSKPKRVDPLLYDHRLIDVVDRGWNVDFNRIRCTIWLARFLIDLKEPPPARPARVVWSDNITRVDATGQCAGDRITIRGSGFGQPKPASVGLVISIAGVCTPVNVDAANWTDTSIVYTLPTGVTSGAVGFVDLNYVAVYNAWVARQNQRVQSALDAARCAGVRVELSPYLTFRECPPLTPFNYVSAGAAIINGFTANWQTLLVVQPSDAISLHWDVTNAVQVIIARTSADGPLLAGATQLITTAQTGVHALGPPNHTGPQEFIYRLTAVGPCGTVTAQVRIIATRAPALRIDNFEITQGLQTTAGDVRRVAQKPTVVRVFVGHGLAGWGANAVPSVTGRARIRRGLADASAWFDPVNGSNPIAATLGAAITVPASPQRRNTNDTLNFLIPAFQCFGTAVIDVEVTVNGFDARAGWAGHSQLVRRTSVAVTFETRRALELRYIRVNWGGNTPANVVCDTTLRASLPLLPLPTVVVAPLAGVGVQTPSATTNNGRNDLLDEFDDRHNCSTWEALWEWLGADCPDDDGAIWVLIPGVLFQGRAYDIPSNVCFTPPNDGPYAAHELAHCLNQRHLGVLCASTGVAAPGGDAATSWPNGGLLADIPFDITTNATVTGDANGVWDVMTYCGTPTVPAGSTNNTWPTPQRWQRLFDFVGS